MHICSIAAAVTRLCYTAASCARCLTVSTRTREPLQIGAEIYGHRGIESDLEVQRLMLRALQLAGVHQVSVDIATSRCFARLLRRARVAKALGGGPVSGHADKDAPAIATLARDWTASTRSALTALPELYGGAGGAGAGAPGAAGTAGDPCGAARFVGAVETTGRLVQIRSFEPRELRVITITACGVRGLCQRPPECDGSGRALR